jgi:hypothetical protein
MQQAEQQTFGRDESRLTTKFSSRGRSVSYKVLDTAFPNNYTPSSPSA